MPAGALAKARHLFTMTKPLQLLLLMITMYGAYFIAAEEVDPVTLLLLTVTGVGGAGGVTALNMYLERDIDSLMPRTSKRPLPSGSLSPGEALAGIVLLIVAGVLAGAAINKYVAFTVLAGLYFDIIGYTEIAKRRSEWALLLGSVAGSMPALGGWAAGRGVIDLPGVILAGIVFAWQPLHVAFIHYYYKEDYERAGIPTIPGRLGDRRFGLLSVASIIGFFILVWAFYFSTGVGLVAASLASIMAARALVAAKAFTEKPERTLARRMIKYASPLVGIVFIVAPLEAHLLGVVGV